MASAKNLFFLFLCYLLLIPAYSKCQQSFQCGNFSFEFPFSDNENPECGLFMVDSCDSDYPRIHRRGEGLGYSVMDKISSNQLRVRDPMLELLLSNHSCLSFTNMFLHKSPSVSFTFSPNLTLFSCINHSHSEPIEERFRGYDHIDCRNPSVYYKIPINDVPAVKLSDIPLECSEIQLPRNPDRNSGNLFDMLSAEFMLEWNVSEACLKCYHGGSQCLTDNEGDFYCKKGKSRLVLILAISLPGVGVLLLLLVTCIIWQRKKRISGNYLLRNISSSPSSKSDIEGGSFYFGIPVFSYSELEETTGNFDPCNELGDGGFGTVYYGKLRDGREVAIKRLYEHNYRRVEQFMNEIKILTGLRHPNLVSLYGCTSRRSRELLLVYEYISNGTVAEHLHGDRAKELPLTWPVRMSIAIETATALAYLHSSDIIHRDVKTNNILLDSNCRVKVADFGLSRLFPIDVTHISTAPQGTPGYVDPEYHQCYQLTDKSDVYSFGVVLIELVSSMPAVDISRHRHEINLANLALNRIQRCAFDELIDPSLGYDSDAEVARKTTSVAELAFRCLQLEKDLRPAMDEVVAFLKDIQGGEDCNDPGKIPPFPGNIPPSPETDDVGLLMNKNFQPSPNAVTDRWASSGSTTTSSIG